MTWFDYLLIAWWVFSTIVTVATVGKPRQTLEPGAAAFVVVINGALVFGLLWSRGAFA